MKRKALWEPSAGNKQQANMTRFISFVNGRQSLNIQTYDELYDWSVTDIPGFWAALWSFLDIRASKQYDAVVDDLAKFPGARWFPGARLNFAENLLRYRDNHLAIIVKDEVRPAGGITYAELYNTVGRLARALQEMGVVPGDRVAGRDKSEG